MLLALHYRVMEHSRSWSCPRLLPRATLTLLSCSSNFPSASHLNESTLTYEPIVNYEMNKLLPAQWRVISDDIRERWHSASFTSLKNKLALNLYWPKDNIFGIKPCVCSLYSSLLYFAVQNKPISFLHIAVQSQVKTVA